MPRVSKKNDRLSLSLWQSHLSPLLVEVYPGVCVRLQVPVLQHVPHEAEGEARGQHGLETRATRTDTVQRDLRARRCWRASKEFSACSGGHTGCTKMKTDALARCPFNLVQLNCKYLVQ